MAAAPGSSKRAAARRRRRRGLGQLARQRRAHRAPRKRGAVRGHGIDDDRSRGGRRWRDAAGYSDAERLACGELIYTGLSRSFVMRRCGGASRGRMTPLMRVLRRWRDVVACSACCPRAPICCQVQTVGTRPSAHRPHGSRAWSGTTRPMPIRGVRALAAWFAEAQLRLIADGCASRAVACRIGRRCAGDRGRCRAARRRAARGAVGPALSRSSQTCPSPPPQRAIGSAIALRPSRWRCSPIKHARSAPRSPASASPRLALHPDPPSCSPRSPDTRSPARPSRGAA